MRHRSSGAWLARHATMRTLQAGRNGSRRELHGQSRGRTESWRASPIGTLATRLRKTLLAALSVTFAAAALAPTAFARTTTWTKGPYLQGLSPNAVFIDAEVDPPGPMRVEVTDEGAPSPGGPLVFDDPHVDDFHSLHVTGLTGGHHYLYTIHSGDASVTAHVTTPPPIDANAPSAPFSFLVYGDTRTDDAAHAAVVRRVAETPGDFLVNTGDMVEDGADQDDWKTFFRIEGTILRERCLYPCVGNHELVERSGENYLAFFGPHDLGCSGATCE